MTAQEKFSIAKNAALSKKAEKLLLLNVKEITSIADLFFILQGKNRSQTQAIADEIMDKLEEEEAGLPLRKEGYENGGWILLDYGDLIIHIFMPEENEYFHLPRLWKDAEKTEFDEEGNEIHESI